MKIDDIRETSAALRSGPGLFARKKLKLFEEDHPGEMEIGPLMANELMHPYASDRVPRKLIKSKLFSNNNQGI